MPDSREAVMINKLALEYRKIRFAAGIASGEIGALQLHQGIGLNQNRSRMDINAIQAWTKLKKRENYEWLKLGMTGNNTLQHHFRQATP